MKKADVLCWFNDGDPEDRLFQTEHLVDERAFSVAWKPEQKSVSRGTIRTQNRSVRLACHPQDIMENKDIPCKTKVDAFMNDLSIFSPAILK